MVAMSLIRFVSRLASAAAAMALLAAVPALAAADDGVPVQVVADACAGVDDESHAKTLDILRLYGPLVEVISLADAIGHAPGSGAAQPA